MCGWDWPGWLGRFCPLPCTFLTGWDLGLLRIKTFMCVVGIGWERGVGGGGEALITVCANNYIYCTVSTAY